MSYPQTTADRVLQELGIDSLQDLKEIELIAWERGALVREGRLVGAEARITQVGSLAVITVSTRIVNHQRKRFSIAHELGHLELHRHQTPIAACLTSDIDDWGRGATPSLEQEANEFASALLLPKRFFVPQISEQYPSLDLVAELAETFNTSLTATAIRFTRFCDEPIVMIFSQDGHIKWFRGTSLFEEIKEDLGIYIAVRSPLESMTRASIFFRGGSIPAGYKRVRASAWFASGRYRDGATLLEQSLPMPSHNAVLSLLWIDDDIEVDSDDSDDDSGFVHSWLREP